MYKILPSREICGRKLPCEAGYPEDTLPDLCFYNTNFPSRFTSINGKVLIQALLNSQDLLAQFGYKLINVNDTPISQNVEEQPLEQTNEATPSSAPEEPVPHKREYTEDEKLVLTAARKAYARENQCEKKYASAYVREHAEEILAAARERGEL